MRTEDAEGASAEAARSPRRAGVRSAGSVVALTVLTLGVYFYVHLFRALGRLQASEDPLRQGARRARRWATAGLLLQFLAFLVVLVAVGIVLGSPAGVDRILGGLEEDRLVLPPDLARIEGTAGLVNWIGWLVFWVPLFSFLRGADPRPSTWSRAAELALALIGMRTLAALAGVAGAPAIADAAGRFDLVLYLALVACCADGLNVAGSEAAA